MYLDILKESGYFRWKEREKLSIFKKDKFLDKNLHFLAFAPAICFMFIMLILPKGFFNAWILMLPLISMVIPVGIGLKIKKLKNETEIYLKENFINFFKKEENLLMLYKELEKDMDINNELFSYEFKNLLDDIDDEKFDFSLQYTLELWLKRKTEALKFRKQELRYKEFMEKTKEEISAYQDYL